MGNNPEKREAPQFLSGWKEIANYLGKGVRTVQRYERQLGLPVRRPAGKPWGSVVATKAELDAWVSASPIRDVFLLTKPLPDPAYAASAESVRKGLEEMQRLRDQTLALRNELRSSVAILRQSIQGLRGELTKGRWREPAGIEIPLELERGTNAALGLLGRKSWERKAS